MLAEILSRILSARHFECSAQNGSYCSTTALGQQIRMLRKIRLEVSDPVPRSGGGRDSYLESHWLEPFKWFPFNCGAVLGS